MGKIALNEHFHRSLGSQGAECGSLSLGRTSTGSSDCSVWSLVDTRKHLSH